MPKLPSAEWRTWKGSHVAPSAGEGSINADKVASTPFWCWVTRGISTILLLRQMNLLWSFIQSWGEKICGKFLDLIRTWSSDSLLFRGQLPALHGSLNISCWYAMCRVKPFLTSPLLMTHLDVCCSHWCLPFYPWVNNNKNSSPVLCVVYVSHSVENFTCLMSFNFPKNLMKWFILQMKQLHLFFNWNS